MPRAVRLLLIIVGTLCIAAGVIGMALPILPTTPFLLLAAACYARSSRRFYNWLLANRWLGPTLRAYRAGLGIPRRQKVLALLLLWITIGGSAAVAVQRGWMRLLLLGIAVGVTVHLLRIKTYTPAPDSAPVLSKPATGRRPSGAPDPSGAGDG